MVIAEQIYNSFRSVFADLMTEKGLVWNGKCFVGCHDDMITRISIYCNVNRYNAKIDIRVLQLPIFCVSLSDMTTKLKWGVSIKRLALLESVDLPDKYDYRASGVDDIIKKYLLYTEQIFDKKFCFSSVCEYIESKIESCRICYESYSVKENELNLKHHSLVNVDLISVIYTYYRIVGSEKTQSAIMALLNMYRSFLYDKMKFGNISELGDIYSEKEIQVLNKIFENYESIMRFAEALLEGNESYFYEIEKNQIRNEAECREYINKLTKI